MKYLKYLLVLLFIVPRKILGLILFWVALPFGKWANNRVFNYVLENGVWLPRLLERPISPRHKFEFRGKNIDGYRIAPYHGTKHGGYIKYKKVSRFEYLLAVCVWGWLDSDSNYYTTDLTFMEKVITGEHVAWLPKWCRKIVHKEVDRLKQRGQYGNSFDLGDYRKFELYWLSSTLWLMRNTAYNWKYLLHEAAPSNGFYKRIWSTHWGYVPHNNPTHKGRLVYGREYYDNVKAD